MGLGVVALGLLIYCTVDCIQTPKRQVRVLRKAAWIPIIILLPLLGPGLWLGFGKARGGNGGGGPRKGPVAPDDDPEFLRNIEFQRRQQQRREEEARKRAEEERKKREAERRAEEKKRQQDDGDVDGDSGPESQPGPNPENN